MSRKRPRAGNTAGRRGNQPGNARPRQPQGTVPAQPVRRDAAWWVDATVFAGVLGMIIVTPWFRGLFFPKEQMVALLVALALFAARWWAKFSRNDYAFLRGPLDWAVFGLWLAYLASTFVAANVRAAIQEDMKYLLYFIVYWLVRELARDERRRAMVLGAIAITGVWVSVLGVGAAAETFQFKGAFDAPRIYSAFQYPNTLAAYLTAAFFSALALWSRAGTQGAKGEIRRAWPTFLWAAAAYASLFVFIFTYSRGALLVFPLVAVAFVALQGRGYRVAGALAILLLALAATLAGRGFPVAVAAHNAAGAWGSFLLGVPLALAANLVLLLFSRVSDRQRTVALGALAGGGVAVAAFLLVRLRLPAEVIARIGTIGLEEYNAWARIQWTKDALQIVKDHPLLGAGGGGWKALYLKYQTYGYWSTEIHNHFVQTWVEVGTLGLLVFLAAWVLLVRKGWTAWRPTSSEGRTVLAGSAAGAIALGLHSTIDFNLSLSAVSLALWACFGTIGAGAAEGGPTGEARQMDGPYRFLPRLAVYSGSFLVAAGLTSLLVGFVYGQKAARALSAGDTAQGRALFEQAVRYDPFTASFRVDLGQAIAASAPRRSVPFMVVEKAVRGGIGFEPNDPNFHAVYGNLSIAAGRIDEGLEEFSKAMDLHPFEIKRYEGLAAAEVSVAMNLLFQGKKEEARSHLQAALAVAERLKAKSRTVPEPARPFYPLPETSPAIAYSVGRAHALAGNYREAEALLTQAGQEGSLKNQSLLWLSVVLEVQGKKPESDAYLQQLRKDEPKMLDQRINILEILKRSR